MSTASTDAIQIRQVVNQFATGRNMTGQVLQRPDYVSLIKKLAAAGGLRTMEPLLPLTLALDGKPYTLKEHFPFSPIFRCDLPKNLMLKTGRQVSKTTSTASRGILLSAAIPFFKSLYITPLFEQVRRFSNNYVRPLIDLSPIRDQWVDTSTEKSVLQRSFMNNSKMQFSFALLDADRVRGISTDFISIDEAQDLDPAHFPIIRECMSHSTYELTMITGTPKSLDNFLESQWQASSQAEWIIRCDACNYYNIPSMEHDIDEMIGPYRDDISPSRPGVVCAKCQRPIDPRVGGWKHRHPERRMLSAGYHVPQIIMPLHYSRPDKWATLLSKREGSGNTTVNQFYNEVLGESTDVGQKLISETELKAAASLPWVNVPNDPNPEMLAKRGKYQSVVLGVDWGGGGEAGVSFTTLAMCGILPGTNRIEVMWGKRLLSPNDHLKEAREIMHWIKVFQPDLMAHDYTGAGIVRETIMVQAGYPIGRIMPMQYVRAKALLKFEPATQMHNRDRFMLDKTRSLLYTIQAIRLQMIRFFQYDWQSDENKGLIYDFLALYEDRVSSNSATDVYLIKCAATGIDDFAHAVNIASCALWHQHQAWPNFADAAGIATLTNQHIQEFGNRDYGWDEDRSGKSNFYSMP